MFTDDAGRAGLRFTFDHDRSPDCQLPETMCGGVGLLDYDGDGWLDVYCVQGGPFPAVRQAVRPATASSATGATAPSRTPPSRPGSRRCPAATATASPSATIDNDGHPDLFVTRCGSYALYRNRGDGTFEDATEAAGLGGDRDWPTSAAFADLDGDGDLDLYVCHYLRWDPDHATRCHDRGDRSGRPTANPRCSSPLPDHLFRNDGGRFVDVTAEAGIVDRDGRGLGVVAADLDDDGRVDLFVANDTTANFLFRNLGGLRFEESGLASGVAANAAGGYQAGMGVACGDLDGDGRPDLAVTNFYGESTTLYHNLGRGLFADQTAAAGPAAPSRYLLGFGIAFLDANNDGRLDLVTANGHVNDSRPHYPYAMPAQLLAGSPSGRFADVTLDAGPPWTIPRLGRGLAVGDLDNDGRVDLLIVSQGEPLAYFHNQTEAGHYLVLRLEGSRSSRDAAGARIVLKSGGVRHSAWRFGGGSYLSASDSHLHFGLGDQDRVESIDVYWPSGQISHFENLRADAAYLLREGQKAPEPLVGFTLTGSDFRNRPTSR